jgi:hypothetical protein
MPKTNFEVIFESPESLIKWLCGAVKHCDDCAFNGTLCTGGVGDEKLLDWLNSPAEIAKEE